MKAKRIIVISIVVLAVIAIVFGWFSGVFTGVVVEERVEGGYKLAGMEYTGSYKKAGEYLNEVEAKLQDIGINCSQGFGIYYDKPGSVPENKCRSFIGCIIDESDYDKLSYLSAAGFRIDSVMKAGSAVAEFPAGTNLSYMIGPMKVYPALSKYFEESGNTPTLSLEIYNREEHRITYIMQFSK